MKIVKRISIIFLCVVLLLISTSCFLDEWQWQRLYQDRHIAWCSNDDVYEYRKGKIIEIFEDYEKREWYRRYYFRVVEYDEEQKEYKDKLEGYEDYLDFNCCIYFLGSEKTLRERGWQMQVGDEVCMKGVLEFSAGYSCFLVAEIWKDGVCYITYEEGKATILECLKGAKSYPY